MKRLLQKLLKILHTIIININPWGHCRPVCKAQPVLLHFAFGLPRPKERKNTMTSVTITNEQKVTATLNPTYGTPPKPAKLDGVPTWEVISGESTVVAAADGLSAELVSSDNPGDTEILVKADADLGSGVVEISDIIKLTVAGANADNLGVTVGGPVPKSVAATRRR